MSKASALAYSLIYPVINVHLCMFSVGHGNLLSEILTHPASCLELEDTEMSSFTTGCAQI